MLWKAETKEKIDEGLLLHNLLRYVKTKDDLGNVVRRAVAQSVVPSQKEEHVTEKLKAIISHPSLEPYFLPGAIVITERAIFKKGNARRVPDRVVLKGDEAVLIDYKTGEERPEYSKQLSEYAELLHDVGYRVSKRILFYTNTLKAVEV